MLCISLCGPKLLCVRAMAAYDLSAQWDSLNMLSKRIPDNQHRCTTKEMERGPSNRTRYIHNGRTK